MTFSLRVSLCSTLSLALLAPLMAHAQAFNNVTVRKVLVGVPANTTTGAFQISLTCNGVLFQNVFVSSPNALTATLNVPVTSVCVWAEVQPLPPAPSPNCVWVVSYPNGQIARPAAPVEVRNTLQCATPTVPIAVSPTTLSINSQIANTARLTYSNLAKYVPAEGFWCGKLISPSSALTGCDPTTLYGQAPASPASAVSATGVFSDVMSMPPSVARRADEAVRAGQPSRFYFVRRFVSASGPATGRDQYVAVTCVLGGGAAVGAFVLTNVRLRVATETPVLFVGRGDKVPPLTVDLQYTGTGRLRGRWEVVFPGEALPGNNDLVSEQSLSPDERVLQKRYLDIERFNVLLQPTGRITLPGPDPSRIPTAIDGSYLLLLRIETPDAGFRMPTFRYIVGNTRSRSRSAPGTALSVSLRLPLPNAALSPDSSFRVSWIDVRDAARYRVEIERVLDNRNVFSAIVTQGLGVYDVPPFVLVTTGERLRWRVVALGGDGRELTRSDWRPARRRQAIASP